MTQLSSVTVEALLATVAAKTPTPGGGAVASTVGALAAALAQMVVSYSVGKKNLAEHQGRLEEAAKTLERARGMLLTLADEDAEAYGLVNELSRLPDGDERKARELPGATGASVQVPLAVAATCVDLLRLFEELAGKTNKMLRSDLAIAAVLAEATVRSSRWNVAINAPSLAALGGTGAADAARMLAEARDLTDAATAMARNVETFCGG